MVYNANRLFVWIVFFVCIAFQANAQSNIYFEDFEDDTVGATSSTEWTIDKQGNNPTYFEVREFGGSHWMAVNNINGEVVWRSREIDISCYQFVDIQASLIMEEDGSLEGSDYIQTLYKIDGGPETFFAVNGNVHDDFSPRKAFQDTLSGSTLQIIVRMSNENTGEVHRFDSVLVQGTLGKLTELEEQICQGDGITIAGEFRTTPGTYDDTLSGAGCDSIVRTELTVVNCDTCVQTVLYYEPFNYPDGTKNTATFTSSAPNNADYFAVEWMHWRAKQVNGTGIWTSSKVSITGFNNVSICLDIWPENPTDFENDDFISISYILDGNETEFARRDGDFDTTTICTRGIVGDTLQVRVKINNDGNGEFHFFDNIKVFDDEGETFFSEIVICEGDSILVGGAYQTTAGTYYDTLSLPNFCESVTITTLIVENYEVDTSWSACPADVALHPNDNYNGDTRSYTYSDTSTSSNGCDSITNVDITFQECDVANPDMVPECPMDVIFVLDESGSIAGQRAKEVRRGADSLLTSLIGTGTRVIIIEFNNQAKRALIDSSREYMEITEASIVHYRNYLYGTNVDKSIGANWYSPDHETNWDDAFDVTASVLINQGFAPLVLFFTDGNPTRSDGPGSNIEDAENSANIVKGLGAHIFVVGLTPVNENNIKRISGDDKYQDPESNFSKADYTLDTDSTLVACFQKIAGLICNADVALTKKVDKPVTVANDTVVFTLRVRNDGLDSTENVAVVDTISSAYIYLSDDGGGSTSLSGNILTWTVGKLLNGEADTLNITAIVTASGNYRNVAQVVSSSANDPNSTPANDDGDQSEDDEDFAIVQLSNLNINCSIVDTVSCDNGMDGSVTVSVNNAIGTVSIMWSTGDTTQTIDSLAPGTYYVTVSDSGSSVSCNVTLDEPNCCVAEPVCQNITIYLDGNGDVSIVADDVDGGSITCGDTLMLAPNTFDCGDLGANSVDLVINGADGNDTCQATVTVLDTTAPVITCPNDLVLDCPANTDTSATGVATATDNCSATITFSDESSPGCGNTDTIVRTWIATDPSGNADTCIQIIIVQDFTPPTAVCTDLTIYLDANGQGSVFEYELIGGTDECGMVTVDSAELNFDCSDVGAHPLDLNFGLFIYDECGNGNSCNSFITVFDTISPTISCPDDVTLDCPAAADTSTTGVATATDNCSAEITFSDQSSPGCGNTDTITRTWIATDASGNADTCYQTITVQDTTGPDISCPGNTSINKGESRDPSNTGQATCTDVCGSTQTTYSDTIYVGQCAGDSIIERTWSCVDDCGNSSSCVQIITETDNTPPNISCPSDTTVECNTSIHPDVLGWAACNGDTVYYEDQVNDGNCPQNKTIVRTWTCVDACGNMTSCAQDINVIDSTDPVISCPDNMTLDCPADTDTSFTGVPTATDNCGTVSFSFNDSKTPGCHANVFTLERIWTATDDCGNYNSCTQQIVVQDTTAPTLPTLSYSDTTVSCTDDIPAADDVVAADCQGDVEASISELIAQKNCANQFVLIRTYTFTDSCGNADSIEQFIFVYDTTSPAITCPGNITITQGDSRHPDNTGEASCTDGCAGNILAYSDVVTEGQCPGDSVIYRTWTCTDSCDNESSCVQIITETANSTPTITCPPDTSVECNTTIHPDALGWATCQYGQATYEDVVYDESSCATEKNIQRTWTCTDVCGNQSICIQSIDIRDNTAPTALCRDITVQLDAGGNATVLTAEVDNGSYDNCGPVTLQVNPANFTCADTGLNVVTLSVWDQCGNGSTCTANVTVEGNASTFQYQVTICEDDSVFAGGGYQNTEGTYYDTLANQFGCDSIVTTDVYVISCNNNNNNNNNSNSNNNNNTNNNNNNNNTCIGEVISLTLVKDCGEVIGVLQDGDIINSNCNASIRADITCGQDIGSVEFKLNGVTKRIENILPYALAGDNNGCFHDMKLAPGPYLLIAIPYSGANGTGSEGISYEVNFTVDDIAPNSSTCLVSVNSNNNNNNNTNTNTNGNTNNNNTNANGNNNNTNTNSNTNNNNTNGNTNNNNTNTNQNNNNTACVGEVISLTLVEECGGDIGGISDGDVINVNCATSIRADVACDEEIGSVEFVLNGVTKKIENLIPYAIAGDNNGCYHTMKLNTGVYHLIAIPHSGPNATGSQGISHEVSFTVSDAIANSTSCLITDNGNNTNSNTNNNNTNGNANNNDNGNTNSNNNNTNSNTNNNNTNTNTNTNNNNNDNGDYCAYIQVRNYQSSSWKKLKMSYEPGLWTANAHNVTAGGNNEVCITLRDVSGNANWSKIQFRPDGSGSVNLGAYGSVGNTWTTICIPLSDFGAADFTQLEQIHFPNNIGAGVYEIEIAEITFSGGVSPFVWFGSSHYNNGHDGHTNPGAFEADIIVEDPCNVSNKQSGNRDFIDQELSLNAFPNPFKDEVTIEFLLQKKDNVQIEILDLNGQLVKKIFDQHVESGQSYKVIFEAGTLSKGMYFYRLHTDSGEMQIRKLILLE